MDFELVLERLLEQFKKEGVRWAVTGGFALGALGSGCVRLKERCGDVRS